MMSSRSSNGKFGNFGKLVGDCSSEIESSDAIAVIDIVVPSFEKILEIWRDLGRQGK